MKIISYVRVVPLIFIMNVGFINYANCTTAPELQVNLNDFDAMKKTKFQGPISLLIFWAATLPRLSLKFGLSALHGWY